MKSETRVVIVTGGATGLGAACVKYFAAHGWNVAVNYFGAEQAEAAEELVVQAEAAGSGGLALQGDVSRDEDCRRIAAATVERFGRLDALVSSAGFTRMVPHSNLDELTMEDFQLTMAINTAGPFQMARACAAALAEGDGGAIVLISSYGAIYGTGSSIAYAASKGATNTLTMSLARILAPKIRVNAVCPALVADGFVQRQAPEMFEARSKVQIARAPLQKLATGAEIAADIYWLVTGAASITGSVLQLDCGLHLNGDG